MVNAGFRLVIGSWKTMAISSPRTLAHLAERQLQQVAPVEHHRARDDATGGDGTRRITASDVTVLPEPDSPTSATISPASHVEADVVDDGRRTRFGEELHRQRR